MLLDTFFNVLSDISTGFLSHPFGHVIPDVLPDALVRIHFRRFATSSRLVGSAAGRLTGREGLALNVTTGGPLVGRWGLVCRLVSPQ